VPGSNGKG
jgi:aminoglycoside 6-adenylyltransferase